MKSPALVACDLLIVNAYVVSGDEDFTIFHDGALAVDGNTILEIGKTDDLTARYTPRRLIDATDRIAMPGLVNMHNHSPLMVTRGMVEDLGFAPAYTPNIPQGNAISADDALVLARLGLLEMMRFGSTTIVDFYNHPDALARAAAELGVRSFVGGRIVDADMAAVAKGDYRYDRAIGDAMLRDSLDVFDRWDGEANGRIRAILGPHAADTCSRDLLVEVGKLARARNATVHTHLAQSEIEVKRIRERDNRTPGQLFEEIGLLDEKLIAGHCIHVDDEEIARLGRAGVRVAHSPIGNAVSGRIAPCRALEEAGATITLCTDTKSGDMFEAMRMAAAVARIRKGGYELSAPTVMAWGTRNGAASLGLADRLGMLKAGQLADIVLLDATAPNLCPLIDGAGQVVYSAVGMNVETVIVDGRVILEKGMPTLVDGYEVVKTAQKVSSELWRRYRQ